MINLNHKYINGPRVSGVRDGKVGMSHSSQNVTDKMPYLRLDPVQLEPKLRGNAHSLKKNPESARDFDLSTMCFVTCLGNAVLDISIFACCKNSFFTRSILIRFAVIIRDDLSALEKKTSG